MDRRDAGSEAGQTTTFLAITMMCFVIAVTFWLLVPLGRAVDHRSGAQKAADASALAAARHVQDKAPGQLRLWLKAGAKGPAPRASAMGYIPARGFSGSNDATLTSLWWSDREVTTTVRDNTAIEGRQAEASATAEIGFNPSLCRLEGPGGVPWVPVPGSNPGLRCGQYRFAVLYEPDTETYVLVTPDADIAEKLAPRLV